MTVAIIGAGVMGETLLSGLIRAGRSVDDLVVGEKRTERAAELVERYGVSVLSNTEATAKADTVTLVVKPQDMADVLAEIDVGSPRAEAFKKMAGRLKIPDITALVDALVQSEELGWPLADTLEGLADRLSGERMLRAQSTAGAAGVYVMLPSTLVLLSAVLLLFAPFIVRYLVTGTLAD